MPSHPDRVRRNYVTTQIIKSDNRPDDSVKFYFNINKMYYATWPSAKEVASHIARMIYDRTIKELTTAKVK